jgi:hypothetical protein
MFNVFSSFEVVLIRFTFYMNHVINVFHSAGLEAANFIAILTLDRDICLQVQGLYIRLKVAS